MRQVRKCKFCGEEFVARSGMQKYCCEKMLAGNPYHRVLPTSRPKKAKESVTKSAKTKNGMSLSKVGTEQQENEVLDYISGEEVMSIYKVKKSWLYTSAKRNYSWKRRRTYVSDAFVWARVFADLEMDEQWKPDYTKLDSLQEDAMRIADGTWEAYREERQYQRQYHHLQYRWLEGNYRRRRLGQRERLYFLIINNRG